MQFLLRADQPYTGHAQSVLNTDGTVAYTDGLTVAQYEAKHGYPLRIVSEAELGKLDKVFCDGMVTKPKLITHQRFWDMLEILPPCRWHDTGGFEVFHVSERITHNLVSWFAHKRVPLVGQRYWEFTDRDNLTDAELATKLATT